MREAQRERLHMLMEEAAEVVQACAKTLRHGYESHHPDDPETSNRRDLEREILDFQSVYLAMIRAGDVRSPGSLEDAAEERWLKKLRYARHQR